MFWHFESMKTASDIPAELIFPGDSKPSVFHSPSSGPAGKGGFFLTWPRAGGPAMEYSADRQEWHDLGGGVWVGWENGRRPAPDELLRDGGARIAGLPTMMADGNFWELPSVLRLPYRYRLRGGVETREIESQWQWAVDLGEKMLAEILSSIQDETEVNQQAMRLNVCRLAAINYRITPELFYFLGVFDERSWFSAASRCVDVQMVVDAIQKKRDLIPTI